MRGTPPLRVRVARDARSVRRVAELFREYAAGLGFPLDFQDFEEELQRLPGPYAPPGGTLLLAEFKGELAGCVGLRPLDSHTCEMKRLYVRPGCRGFGVGRRLVERVVEEGRSKGYRRMRLDTVPRMIEAIALYRRFGFSEIPAYRFNPIPGALFFELRLQQKGGRRPIRAKNPPARRGEGSVPPSESAGPSGSPPPRHGMAPRGSDGSPAHR